MPSIQRTQELARAQVILDAIVKKLLAILDTYGPSILAANAVRKIFECRELGTRALYELNSPEPKFRAALTDFEARVAEAYLELAQTYLGILIAQADDLQYKSPTSSIFMAPFEKLRKSLEIIDNEIRGARNLARNLSANRDACVRTCTNAVDLCKEATVQVETLRKDIETALGLGNTAYTLAAMVVAAFVLMGVAVAVVLTSGIRG